MRKFVPPAKTGNVTLELRAKKEHASGEVCFFPRYSASRTWDSEPRCEGKDPRM